jgi:uncharacterized membrane protein
MLEIIELVGQSVDVAGVVVMVLGMLMSTLYFLNNRRRGHNPAEAYQNYRHGIGRAILLGLEILIVADIIRTIALEPTFSSLGILAIIILIRTFLSATLELELEGRWPWQRRAGSNTLALSQVDQN